MFIERTNYNKVITVKLVVPSSCNAKCKFCYMNSYDQSVLSTSSSIFLNNFQESLNLIIDKIYGKNPISLDITGNEPTIDVKLIKIILRKLKASGIKHKLSRVTMTSNGLNMLYLIDCLAGFVDYVNISVHSFSYDERFEIMKYTKTDDEYRNIIESLAANGIKTSAVAVIDREIDNFAMWRDKFISWCKTMGFISLRFRCDAFSDGKFFNKCMDETMSDKKFQTLVFEDTPDSRWCRLRMDDKFRVFFLHGVVDTSKVVKGIEYIVHTDGKCYCDFYKKTPLEKYQFDVGKIYDKVSI